MRPVVRVPRSPLESRPGWDCWCHHSRTRTTTTWRQGRRPPAHGSQPALAIPSSSHRPSPPTIRRRSVRLERESDHLSGACLAPPCESASDRRIRGSRDRRQMPKARDAIRLVESAGWVWVRTRGSHRQYQHPRRPGTVTVAGKLRDSVAPKTWRSILRQAGLDRRED